MDSAFGLAVMRGPMLLQSHLLWSGLGLRSPAWPRESQSAALDNTSLLQFCLSTTSARHIILIPSTNCGQIKKLDLDLNLDLKTFLKKTRQIWIWKSQIWTWIWFGFFKTTRVGFGFEHRWISPPLPSTVHDIDMSDYINSNISSINFFSLDLAIETSMM